MKIRVTLYRPEDQVTTVLMEFQTPPMLGDTIVSTMLGTRGRYQVMARLHHDGMLGISAALLIPKPAEKPPQEEAIPEVPQIETP